MSTEADTGGGPPLTLAEYIAALIDELGRVHPTALARMRYVIGTRRARIALDNEAVEVRFEADRLAIAPAAADAAIDGSGSTDSSTVLDILNGYLEVNQAILDGRLLVEGDVEDVHRIFIAIEILLDASARTPGLRQLASRFARERDTRDPHWVAQSDEDPWHPFVARTSESELLSRLGLLPGAVRGRRRT
jgi:hypothetical protein